MNAEQIEDLADSDHQQRLANHLNIRLQIATQIVAARSPNMDIESYPDGSVGHLCNMAIFIAENLLHANETRGVYWMAPSVQESLDELLEEEVEADGEPSGEELWSEDEGDEDE